MRAACLASRAFLTLLVALAGDLAGAAPAQPSSGWVQDGAADLEKTVFMEALKRVLGPGGDVVANVSDWVIDPLVTASTTPGTTDEKVDAYMAALGQAGLNVVWPAYGLTLTAGKLTIGGALYTIEQMIAGARSQQARAVLTGDTGFLGGIGNPAARAPFFSMPYVVNTGVTVDNIGARVANEAELRQLWHERYFGHLRDHLFSTNEARNVVDMFWPELLRMWRFQRAELGVRQIVPALDGAIRQAREARARYKPRVPVASSGRCAGSLAGQWRMTQRMATGYNFQDWIVYPGGRAVEKVSNAEGSAYIEERTLVIRREAGPGGVLVYTVVLDEKCVRGNGVMQQSGTLRDYKDQTEARRMGEAPPLGVADAPPPKPPVTAGGSEQPSAPPPMDVPTAIPSAPITQGPLPAQPIPQPIAQPAPQPGLACNQVIGGPYLAKWRQLGGERGPLGCPTTVEVLATTSPQGSVGTWMGFQHGIMTMMRSGPKPNEAFEVHGRIKDAYGQLGGSASWLGFPVSDEYDVPGGRRNDFEGGSLMWDHATNQVRAERAGTPRAGGGPPACDASGVWQATTDGVGAATWTFEPAGAGRYSARERGLGNATGTATLSGTRLRVDWTTGAFAGHYEWELGPACSGGGGQLVFSRGRAGAHASHLARAEGPGTPLAGGAPPACDASGVWQAATEGIGAAMWTFEPTGAGRYSARERGLGNATGTAMLIGTRLRVDWITGPFAGHYEWDLGPACGGGGGQLVFRQGRVGTHASRIARAQPAAQQPPAPGVTEGHVPAPPGGRNFPQPQMAGAIVDWCTTWGTNCGQAGADQFCRTQGHERAASFVTYNAGRTYVIGSRQICQGPHCVGFAQVVCMGAAKH